MADAILKSERPHPLLAEAVRVEKHAAVRIQTAKHCKSGAIHNWDVHATLSKRAPLSARQLHAYVLELIHNRSLIRAAFCYYMAFAGAGYGLQIAGLPRAFFQPGAVPHGVISIRLPLIYDHVYWDIKH